MELGQRSESPSAPNRSTVSWPALRTLFKKGRLESWILVYFWFTYHALMSPFYIQQDSEGYHVLHTSKYQKVTTIFINQLLLAYSLL